jgi:hypothetical protein
MTHAKTNWLIILVVCLFCGCSYVPPSTSKSDWYATIENHSGKSLLVLNANEWMPLFGADGFGGNRRVMLYFSDLEGDGPVFQNPVFGEFSAPKLASRHLGTIAVNDKKGEVEINLQQIISKPGDPVKTESCPANGVYPLKRWKDSAPPR